MTWIKDNLFGSVKDGLITVFSSLFLGWLAFVFLKFVFADSDWEINRVNLRLFMVGRYPAEHEFRIVIFLVACAVMVGVVAGLIEGNSIRDGKAKSKGLVELVVDYVRRFWVVTSVVVLLLVWAGTFLPVVLLGGVVLAAGLAKFVGRVASGAVPDSLHRYIYIVSIALPIVALYFVFQPLERIDDLGGFFLNMVVAIGSIAVCFPIGVVLALGRRSKMRVISWLSTAYIELVRGAPLYVLLLLAGTLVEFVMPGTFSPPNLLRAAIVFVAFTGAYMAEIVRGGLQSLPKGQQEAAQALGLSPFKQTTLIVLPQALRNVIPAQVGQLISLFKDTTLAGVALSLFDVLVVARAVIIQDDFRGEFRLFETLLFTALLFWVVSYTASRESQRFEKKLGVGL